MTKTNHDAVSTPAIDVNQVFDALETWIKQRPGLDIRDYGTDRNGLTAYRQEIRQIGRDRTRAMKALDEARGLTPARPDALMGAFQRAFSGRLELKHAMIPHADDSATCICGKWECSVVSADHQTVRERWLYNFALHIEATESALEYTTGQYWPTEYRKAAASVLETYIADWLRADAAENPQVFTYRTMDDVIAANRSIGGHWFDRDTMRFFKTKIESGAVPLHSEGCHKARFISSEKGPDGVRRYSVREAQPDGSIDTIGEFQAYRTRDKARANLLTFPAK